jgi:hypothetical protein
MALEPTTWNVIAVGAWNKAILTPRWVAMNIFKLPEGTPVALEVPVNDMLAPWRVRHAGITVAIGRNNLDFSCDTATFPTLELARQLANLAISQLPQTPITAVGYNVRYRSAEPLPDVAELIANKLEGRLSDNEYEIASRTNRTTLLYKGGFINVEVTLDGDGTTVTLNFHLGSSNVEELGKWLTAPINEIEVECHKLLQSLKA